MPDFLHPNSLHSFQNARQVGLCLLPIVFHFQYLSSKVLDIKHIFEFLFHMFVGS